MSKLILPIATIGKLRKLALRGLHAHDWYVRAAKEIRAVCAAENWDSAEFATILALTSPRVSVRRNVRITLHYCATGALLGNVMRGVRRSIETYFAAGEILGPKVSAFRAALLGDENAIVLDVHMAKALEVHQAMFSRDAVRLVCERKIRKLARDLGLSPRDTQATIWAGQYWASTGQIAPYFPISEEYVRFLDFGKKYPAAGSIDKELKRRRKAAADKAQRRLFA